jgi:hypothetical protein
MNDVLYDRVYQYHESHGFILLLFLSMKVAPLQLAVGVGGTCLIAGGTWGIIQGGEWLCDELETFVESKRLEARKT